MIVNIKKLDSLAQIPTYAKPGDAGLDLTAISKEVTPEYIEYGTGLAIEIPQGYVGLIFPRSSISKYDLSLANAVGVIDSGYRGEIKFRFKNATTINRLKEFIISWVSSKDHHSAFEYSISDKVGQLIILPYPSIVLSEVKELSGTERGEGGFGSSNA